MNVKKYILSRVKSSDFEILNITERIHVLRDGMVREDSGVFTSFKGYKLFYIFTYENLVNLPEDDSIFQDISIILTSLKSPLLCEIKQLHRIKI
jgi:hypothetical protein